MNKFFIGASSACMERMLDCQKIYSYLTINGWILARKVSDADLLIISTCAFGEYEDRCCMELIRHYVAQKKRTAQVILVGCLPVINPSKLDEICNFSSVSPTNLDQLDSMLDAKVKFSDVAEPNRILSAEVSYKPSLKKFLNAKSAWNGLRSSASAGDGVFKKQLRSIKKLIRSTVFLKAYINPFLVGIRERLFYLRISKGCLGNCSYCAKKFATGKLRSKALEQILDEFKKGLELKEKCFFLLTEDSGCYGLDIGTNIVELLKEIFAAGDERNFKLIMSNLNAEWFLKYYNEIEEIIIKHQAKIFCVHIPIQSGSDRILRLMGRPYQINDVKRGLKRLRDKVPGLSISTDIMVGFPGETEEDFYLTQEFLKEIKFDFADIFGYESRPKTPALKLPGRLSNKVIEERRFCLLKIQNENAKLATVVKKIAEVSEDFVHRKV